MNLSKIDMLIEQTTFLHDKQKELLTASEDAFGELLEIVEAELKVAKDADDNEKAKNLKEVQDYIIQYKEKSEAQVVEDIEFLQEQIQAITKIKTMEDKVKAQELMDMIVASEDELFESEEFKKQVEEDVHAASKEMKFMLEDLKDAVKDGDIKELKLLLEATILDEEECVDDDCSSCSGCSSSCSTEDDSCDSSCCGGNDIFSAFGDLDDTKKK